jgi:hypothetical protein
MASTGDKKFLPPQFSFTHCTEYERELVCGGGVQASEDARNLTSLRARRRLLQN